MPRYVEVRGRVVCEYSPDRFSKVRIVDSGFEYFYVLEPPAVAAKHPGTVIRVILVVPEGSSITLSGNRIILENIALPESIVAFYRKTELGESRGLVLQTSFRFENNITLTSGIYLLEIESRPGYIKVSILDYRNLKA